VKSKKISKNLPNVWQIPDRHGGKPFNYLRVTGQPKVPLPRGNQLTPEFRAAYCAALAGTAPPPPRRKDHQPFRDGSVDAMIAAYQATDDYARLVRQDAKLRAFERIREKMHLGDCLVAQTDWVLVAQHIDKLGKTHPGAARELRTAFSLICQQAVKHRLISANPIREIVRPKLKNVDGLHDWTELEIAAYKRQHKPGTLARYALDVLLETGLRVSDAARVGDQHVIDDNTITLIPQKTKKLGERARVYIPIFDELRASRDAMTVVGKDRWLVTLTGKRFTAAYLGDCLAQWIDEAGLQACCTPHGLRKSFVRRKIDAGHSVDDVMVMTGHQDRSLVMFYARQRDKRLAAERVRKAS
jgi:integrase